MSALRRRTILPLAPWRQRRPGHDNAELFPTDACRQVRNDGKHQTSAGNSETQAPIYGVLPPLAASTVNPAIAKTNPIRWPHRLGRLGPAAARTLPLLAQHARKLDSLAK